MEDDDEEIRPTNPSKVSVHPDVTTSWVHTFLVPVQGNIIY